MSRPYFSPSSRRDLADILELIARDKPGAALRTSNDWKPPAGRSPEIPISARPAVICFRGYEPGRLGVM